MFLINPD